MKFVNFADIPKDWADGRLVLFRLEYRNDEAPEHSIAQFSDSIRNWDNKRNVIPGWHHADAYCAPVAFGDPAVCEVFCVEIARVETGADARNQGE